MVRAYQGGYIVESARVFTCARCGKQFTKLKDSDEKAEVEYLQRYEEFALAGASRRLVCTDCYTLVTGGPKK